MNCEHVYSYVGMMICPKCGLDTHEPDWEAINEAHKKHVLENPDFQYSWWSI